MFIYIGLNPAQGVRKLAVTYSDFFQYINLLVMNMTEKVMKNEFLNSNYLPISKMLKEYTEVIDISIELS